MGVCVRRAWLTLDGLTVPLEDEAAAYYCEELNLGYPEVRDQVSNRPDANGADDRTRLFGPRAVTADISARAGVLMLDEIADLFAPLMVPSARPVLHYVLDRPDTPERVLTVRASGFDAPVSGASSRKIHLAFVAADPTLRDPVQRVAIARSGSSQKGGRTYPLRFPRAYTAGGGVPSTGSIESAGDVPFRPLLRIFGPITDPQVTLRVGGSTFSSLVAFVPGFIIAAGKSVDVDLDRRTVTGDDGANLMSSLDWAQTTWPELPPAPPTSMQLVGTSTTGVTQVQALWLDAYLS